MFETCSEQMKNVITIFFGLKLIGGNGLPDACLTEGMELHAETLSEHNFCEPINCSHVDS